jgi:hypothetical protein
MIFEEKLLTFLLGNTKHLGSFGSKGEQNLGIENPPLRTRMIIKMISPWITLEKGLGSYIDWSFQIRS